MQLFKAEENERLAVLNSYDILDTAPEEAFERIISLAMQTLGVPLAAVSLVDRERQWFKAQRGFPGCETSRDISFCDHAIRDEDVFVVPDTRHDSRFAENPLVSGEPKICFYAGAALRTPEGQNIGTLCISDHAPRQLDGRQRTILRQLAAMVVDEMILRKEILARKRAEEALHTQHEILRHVNGNIERRIDESTRELRLLNRTLEDEIQRREQIDQERQRSEVQFRLIFDQASDAAFLHDMEGRLVDANHSACTSLGYSREELLELGIADIDAQCSRETSIELWTNLLPGQTECFESYHRRKDGSRFPVEVHVSVSTTHGKRLLLALARDSTERKHQELHLRGRVRQQETVARLGASALSGMGPDELFQQAVSLVSETLGVEFSRVHEHLPEQGIFITRAALGHAPDSVGKTIRQEDCQFVFGYMLKTGGPVIIDDLDTEARFEVSDDTRASGVKSGIWVLIGRDGTGLPRFGTLEVSTKERRHFTAEDVHFVQTAANVLAAAVARRRNEDALRVVEARYQRIAANTPGMVFQSVQKPEGSFALAFVSEGCRSLFGLEPRQLYAQPELISERVHPEERNSFLRLIQESKASLRPLHWEGRHLLPDGGIRWIRVDARPERLPTGDVLHDGIIMDTTAQHRTQAALRQSEERFRLANMHAPFPVMLFTSDGEVWQVNDAWTHRTGYLAQELPTIEAWFARAYPSAQVQEAARQFAAELWQHIGAVESAGRQVRCANGETRIWDFSFANLERLPDGRWLHLATAIDVTERHQAETALRLAKSEAERTNTAKSEFLSRMSHELRTPLNAILGFGQLLELSNLSEQESLSATYILKAGRHLLSLVDEVLDLTRAETGELHLNLAPVPVKPLVLECIGLVTRMAQARGIRCEANISARAVTVLADEQRLRQTLLNLLANAIKYNCADGKVTVSSERTAAGRLRIKVRDTGPGIPPEGVARLFVPFERLEQEFGDVEGTGLGLVVSQRLIEAMDGTLSAESQVGQGSTFQLELPIPEPNAVRSAAKTHRGPQTPPVQPGPVDATLLYIEDNASNLQVVQMILARQHPQWRLVTAAAGLSGLELAREHRPDLILLDLQLPDIQGDAVLGEILNDPSLCDTPVIVLSADATAHSRDRLLACGASNYLPKPFKLDDLLKLLEQTLTRGKLASRPAKQIALG